MLKLQEFHSIIIFELLPNRSAAAMIPDDNNAKEIITIFYRRAKARQIFRGYFVPRADTQTDIFFLRAHCYGKRGLFLFTYRKYCYYFPSSFYGKE